MYGYTCIVITGTPAKEDEMLYNDNMQSIHIEQSVQDDQTSVQSVGDVSDSSSVSTAADSVTAVPHEPCESGEQSKRDDGAIKSKDIGVENNYLEHQPSRSSENYATDDSQKINDVINISIQDMSSAVWEWKDSDGQWQKYSSDVQDKLRKSFLKNPKSTVLVLLNDS
jgi:hypothetical protein